MLIRHVQDALRKEGIQITNQAVRHLLRERYHIYGIDHLITFPEEVGQEIINYYKLKNRRRL
jgi:predicted XRE-type DNA-binding protein